MTNDACFLMIITVNILLKIHCFSGRNQRNYTSAFACEGGIKETGSQLSRWWLGLNQRLSAVANPALIHSITQHLHLWTTALLH